MFYQPYKPRRKRLRRGCLSKILKGCLVALAIYLLAMLYTNGTMGDIINSIKPGGLPLGYTNILLLGADGPAQSSVRTDTMIVASISNSGRVKLTSLMRDTLVSVEGHGVKKLNSAYAYGGSDLAIKTVNNAFGLNISRYAVIDFSSFASLIDELGGVRLPVTKSEMEAMNKKKGHKLANYGDDVLLDGVQALRYVRIRKIDSDYQRSNRQRRLLSCVLAQLRSMNPLKLVSLASSAGKYVKTNMPMVSIAINAIKALGGQSGIEQLRIPAEGTYESGMMDGVWSIRADLAKNAALIREFIYTD